MHEFEMIREYFRPLTMDRAEAGGLLDDAAILNIPEGFDLVVSSDSHNSGVHFLESEEPANIAHKCLRSNLSDMAAMGAEPYCYQLNLAFSHMPDPAWAKEFAGALMADNKEFGVFCSGGDTTVVEGPMVVSLTILGLVPKGRAVNRLGAQIGDLLVVTGHIGDAAIGVKIVLGALDLDAPEYFLNACRKPVPRTAISEFVRTYAHAGIDISDGLIADVTHLCDVGGVGVQLELDKVPFSVQARALLDGGKVGVDDLITGGDDYELALAISPDDIDAFLAVTQKHGVHAHVIGVFVDGKGVQVLDKDRNVLELKRKGWMHF